MAKPEQLVVNDILLKLSKLGYLLFVYESKAVFSQRAKTYLNSQVPKGHPDIAGISPEGFPVYIEIKAKGKLKTLKPVQANFLRILINRDAFAMCADSCELVLECYRQWYLLQVSGNYMEARQLLLKKLEIVPTSNIT